MSNFRIPVFVACAAISLSFVLFQNTTPSATEYAGTITAADLKTHLEIIASDAYEGRETGEKGQKMAAEYIAKQFKSCGIPELPGGGYYQNVPLIKFLPGQGEVVSGGTKYAVGKSFYFLSGVENMNTSTSKIVVAGYGIEEKGFSNYGATNINGATVMIIAGEPINGKGVSLISGKKEPSPWSTQRRKKIMEASKRGAAMLLVVQPEFEKALKDYEHSINTPSYKLDDDSKEEATDYRAPVLYISPKMADEILKAAGAKTTVSGIQKANKKKASSAKTLNYTLGYNISRPTQKVNTENVLGYIEGTDLKEELIVITAHYDHIGKEGDKVYNGADDDGSGTVGIMEIAEAFAKAKREGKGPRRSILCMAVSGEERGLLGSKWYSEHPLFPLAQTVCNLNIDMIGRIDADHKKDSNYVYVIGADRISADLKTIVNQQNELHTKLTLDYKYDVENEPNMYYYRSDHYNFARKGVPVAFFFNGTHEDYHKETDETSKITYPMMEVRTRLVFFTAWEIAHRTDRLRITNKK
jgi:hypothetical protein